MQRTKTLARVVVIGIALGGVSARTPFAAPPAAAAQTWNVQVGADVDLTNGITANAYFPNSLTVDAGDTVSWTFPAALVHTVTFDNGTVPPLATSGNVVDPAFGSDDISTIINPIGLSSPSPTFNPRVQISSGVPLDPPDQRRPFTLSFAQPGVYHYDCALHGPAMAGTVTVLPTSAAVPETPAQATARGQAELAEAVGDSADFFAANALTDVAVTASPAVHNVVAGAAAGDGISLLQFLQKDLTVQRGDTVVWTVADPAEAHTITFLSGGAEPQFLAATPRADGSTSFVFPANVFSPSGGTTYTGQGYLNSGFFVSGQAFAARIDAPPGRYEYICLIHAVGFPYNMRGTITVTP